MRSQARATAEGPVRIDVSDTDSLGTCAYVTLHANSERNSDISPMFAPTPIPCPGPSFFSFVPVSFL